MKSYKLLLSGSILLSTLVAAENTSFIGTRFEEAKGDDKYQKEYLSILSRFPIYSVEFVDKANRFKLNSKENASLDRNKNGDKDGLLGYKLKFETSKNSEATAEKLRDSEKKRNLQTTVHFKQNSESVDNLVPSKWFLAIGSAVFLKKALNPIVFGMERGDSTIIIKSTVPVLFYSVMFGPCDNSEKMTGEHRKMTAKFIPKENSSISGLLQGTDQYKKASKLIRLIADKDQAIFNCETYEEPSGNKTYYCAKINIQEMISSKLELFEKFLNVSGYELMPVHVELNDLFKEDDEGIGFLGKVTFNKEVVTEDITNKSPKKSNSYSSKNNHADSAVVQNAVIRQLLEPFFIGKKNTFPDLPSNKRPLTSIGHEEEPENYLEELEKENNSLRKLRKQEPTESPRKLMEEEILPQIRINPEYRTIANELLEIAKVPSDGSCMFHAFRKSLGIEVLCEQELRNWLFDILTQSLKEYEEGEMPDEREEKVKGCLKQEFYSILQDRTAPSNIQLLHMFLNDFQIDSVEGPLRDQVESLKTFFAKFFSKQENGFLDSSADNCELHNRNVNDKLLVEIRALNLDQLELTNSFLKEFVRKVICSVVDENLRYWGSGNILTSMGLATETSIFLYQNNIIQDPDPNDQNIIQEVISLIVEGYDKVAYLRLFGNHYDALVIPQVLINQNVSPIVLDESTNPKDAQLAYQTACENNSHLNLTNEHKLELWKEAAELADHLKNKQKAKIAYQIAFFSGLNNKLSNEDKLKLWKEAEKYQKHLHDEQIAIIYFEIAYNSNFDKKINNPEKLSMWENAQKMEDYLNNNKKLKIKYQIAFNSNFDKSISVEKKLSMWEKAQEMEGYLNIKEKLKIEEWIKYYKSLISKYKKSL